MPEERDIEKRLRAYGKQCQKQAPRELHPATRRLFQAEIVRQFGTDRFGRPARPWLAWLGRWRQLAWAGALFVGLAAVVYVGDFLDSEPGELAQADRAQTAPTLTKSIEGSAQMAEENAPQLNYQPSATEPTPKDAGPAASRSLPTADPAAPVVRLAALASTVPALAEAAPSTVVLASPPPAADALTLALAPRTSADDVAVRRKASAVRAVELSRARSSETVELELGQSVLFTNQADGLSLVIRAQPSPTNGRELPANLLGVFRFLQSSNGVQVVDRDGSVYTGEFEVASRASVRSVQEVSESKSRSFQVIGTNTTAQQRLVIRGVALFSESNFLATAPDSVAAKTSVQPAELLPLRVDGTATLDDGREVKIRAVRFER